LRARPNDDVVTNGGVVAMGPVKRCSNIDAMVQVTGDIAFTCARIAPLSRNDSPKERRRLAGVLLHGCIETIRRLPGGVTLVN